jgi:hypothetical protein
MEGRSWEASWFLSMRDVTNATNERTAIFSVRRCLPANDKLPSVFVRFPAQEVGCLVANLSSFVFDYVARQKVGGTNFGGYLVEQLPVLPPSAYAEQCMWAEEAQTVKDWMLPRVLELTYTARDLKPFADDCGFKGEPFVWREPRRLLLRCELDAAFFHLCLRGSPDGTWERVGTETPTQRDVLREHFPTPRDAVSHILDQFPGVRRNDEGTFGSFRTKECILEIYEAILTDIRSGRAYQTKLDPAPISVRALAIAE